MRRVLIVIFTIALLLAGCGAGNKEPDPHPDWDPDWVRVHPHLGVETPDGFALRENSDALRSEGLYYASWYAGEERQVTDSEGKESTVYDAQLHVLVKVSETAEQAGADLEDWITIERGAYEAGDEQGLDAAGQTYRLLLLDSPNGDRPYPHGAAAFALCGTAAISVELLCAGDWPGEAEAVLRQFLEGFHYGFPAEN